MMFTFVHDVGILVRNPVRDIWNISFLFRGRERRLPRDYSLSGNNYLACNFRGSIKLPILYTLYNVLERCRSRHLPDWGLTSAFRTLISL